MAGYHTVRRGWRGHGRSVRARGKSTLVGGSGAGNGEGHTQHSEHVDPSLVVCRHGDLCRFCPGAGQYHAVVALEV